MGKTLENSSIRDCCPWRLSGAAPAALIVLAGWVAYWNSFKGVFLLDDIQAIVQNPTIRSLWPPGAVFTLRQGGSPVSGRPVVNLSLAVNRALGGTEPWGYHAGNLTIHILAGLALFGIIRRTLRLPRLQNRFGGRSTGLALAAAMIWLVHPLQTESVTYLCQRAESLAGLLYLATLYCCLRAFQADRSIGWKMAGVALCLVGMATKETMVTVPLVVLLYDRTFVSPSFREAIRRRWGLYASLAATWALLAVLVFQAGNRGGTAGFGQGVSSWDYAKTQFGAIVHYLRLCFWPNPLVLDYGTYLPTGAWQIVPQAIVVALLLIATPLSMRYLPWAGFLGACFFLILSPTSSFVPVVGQTMAEHRMYLPLAAVIALVVMLADWAWGRLPLSLASVGHLPAAVRWAIPVAALGALVAGEIYLTVLRNNDYRSDLSIWQDTVRKVPSNCGVHYTLGGVLASRGQIAQAIEHYQQALKLNPDYTAAHYNLGKLLAARGQVAQAIEHYQQALKSKPDFAEAHNNLGVALASRGQVTQAIEHYQQALKSKPDFAEAHNNLGVALASRGQVTEAIEQFQQALKSKPDDAEVHNNLGSILAAQGRLDEAIRHFERSLQLKPDYASARENLNEALSQLRADQPATRSAPNGPTRP
jgi:Tfp pilus assembly protein PilF